MVFTSLCLALRARAQQHDDAEPAKKLANPVASLISVPFQYNYDHRFGRNDEGTASRLEIQPVVPLTLNDDWNPITRTIVPLVDQADFPIWGRRSSRSRSARATGSTRPRWVPRVGGYARS